MRTPSLLVVTLVSFVMAGCAADPTPESVEDIGAAAAQLQSGGGPSTGITVDCNESSNATCYECNQPNGVMCCLASQTCTVIPCPKGGCRYIARKLQ